MLTLDNFLTTVTFTKYCYIWNDRFTTTKAQLFHYELVNGPIPPGFTLSKRCENNCCRSAHMALVRDCHPTNYLQRMALTREEREQDRKEAAECEARHQEASAAPDINRNKGKGRKNCFTDDQIREIRRRYKRGHPTNGAKALAVEFGVTPALICRIAKRQCHAKVPDVAPATTAESPAMVQESNYIDQDRS